MAGGRQRSFDKQQALENAMRVFWQKGFIGASLMDLTESMGINKPSMYAAFGNKEQLFIQATNQPKFPIYASTENEFFLKVVKASITFTKNEEGKIKSLTLHQNGFDQEAKKVK